MSIHECTDHDEYWDEWDDSEDFYSNDDDPLEEEDN